MSIDSLNHYSIRTTNLDATRAFYTEVIGLDVGPRPNFPFPGVWLYKGESAVVHVVGIDAHDNAGLLAYLGDGKPLEDVHGGGSIDHVAFTCNDFEGMRARFKAAGAVTREREVPNLKLQQIFIEDPNGITLELNFPG